jgi:hypothetical protein
LALDEQLGRHPVDAFGPAKLRGRVEQWCNDGVSAVERYVVHGVDRAHPDELGHVPAHHDARLPGLHRFRHQAGQQLILEAEERVDAGRAARTWGIGLDGRRSLRGDGLPQIRRGKLGKRASGAVVIGQDERDHRPCDVLGVIRGEALPVVRHCELNAVAVK